MEYNIIQVERKMNRGQEVDSAFDEITQIFHNGIMLILKQLLLYIMLPEILGIVVLGGILRIRGRMLSLLIVGIALLGFYLFSIYGLPELTKADLRK